MSDAPHEALYVLRESAAKLAKHGEKQQAIYLLEVHDLIDVLIEASSPFDSTSKGFDLSDVTRLRQARIAVIGEPAHGEA